MRALTAILWFAGISMMALTLPGTIELFLVTVGALIPHRSKKLPVRNPGSLAIVVPAHNEAGHLSATLQSLKASCKSYSTATIVVVADNCTDDTANIAVMENVRVLERHDLTQVGKGFALQYAFDTLQDAGYGAFAVVDADTIVDDNFVGCVQATFAEGADAVQVPYGVLNRTATMWTRLQSLAFTAFNRLRPMARASWGFSSGILGNGFALSAKTLRDVPYKAHSVVEDVEYHLLLVQAGKRVRFVPDTCVRGLMPTSRSGIQTQRARWEGGRLRLMREWIPQLFSEVLKGRWRLVEPLLDLCLLPLAFHTLLMALGLFIPILVLDVYFLFGFGIVVLHVAVACVMAGCGLKDFLALLLAPFYIGWKLGMAIAIAAGSKRGSVWRRTERD